MAIGDKVDHEFEEIWQRCLDQAAGTAPRPVLTPDEEWRQSWNITNGHIPSLTGEEKKLADALEAYDAFDDNMAQGGRYADLSPSAKRALENSVYIDHGPRPDKQVAAEFAARRAAEKHRAGDITEWAQIRAENEAFNLAQVQALGFNSVEDWRNGVEAPQPYLADRGVGEPRAYVLPNSNGQTVDEWTVVAGRPALNPEFAKITDHLERRERNRRR